MRDDDKVWRGSSVGESSKEKSSKKGGKKGRHGRRPGFGREMPFQMGNFMQMLPLLLAMGGGNPAQGMAGMQVRIAMLMIEIWIDYLGSMMEFLERTLERLASLGDGGLLFGGGGDDEDDQDGDDW
jgi:hypothetical protein